MINIKIAKDKYQYQYQYFLIFFPMVTSSQSAPHVNIKNQFIILMPDEMSR